ncbi:MAG: O-antigen ligase family protein [Anaerolineae bacterium]
MSQPDIARQHRGRLYTLSCVLLCGLVALSGWAWRAASRERRGIEPAQGDRVLAQGINVELAQYGPAERARALDDVESLGVQWVRQRFPWREVEPEGGRYDWARWDAVVEATSRRGLKLIAVLDGPPDWALRHAPVPLPCAPPWRVEAYARYVGAFARRYGEAIEAYQVWDEPNLSQTWGGGHVAACGYATLLGAAYVAIHEADPAAIVLGGGLAPTQAAGPQDLNDLVYLEQLYALGGGAYFDALAVKGYGFWSGPEDRRVAPDVLNFSRLVAVRELARRRGDAAKPIWAVEWGWHVSSPGSGAAAPPWGTDTLTVQRARILGAVDRARDEWPWLAVMCWAAYQPDVPPADPLWGFALRGSAGQETGLYAVLRQVAVETPGVAASAAPRPSRWALVAGLLALGYVNVGAIWLRLQSKEHVGRAWRWWRARPWPAHLAALLVLALLIAVTPWVEWVAIELALAATVLYLRPRWGLVAAVGTIPLFYASKAIGSLRLAPSEILLYLAALGIVLRRWTGTRAPRGTRGLLADEAGLPKSVPLRRWAGRWARAWSALDVAWLAWVVWGVIALARAPNPADAWHEWRLAILSPALLYLVLSTRGATERGGRASAGPVASAWILSGATVALVGIVQWWFGAPVPAGSVGRVTGVYYSPNHLALFLERVWPLALALALQRGGSRKWVRWAWAAVGLIGTGLYLTYSRGAWLLAVPVALGVLGWTYRRRLRWWMVAGTLIAVVLVASNVLVGRATTRAGLLDEIRIPVWQSTLHMIADRPWLGVGLDGFRPLYPRYMQPEAWTEPVLYHPHDEWLDAAVRTGLPGLALFAALVALCLRALIRWARGATGWQRALATGCVAATLGGLAHGMVDSGYFLPDLAWSLALMAGLAQMETGADRRPRTDRRPSTGRRPKAGRAH